MLNIAGSWENPHDDEANIGWARTAWAGMKRFSTGGSYFQTIDEGRGRLEAALGASLRRLGEIKSKWDPANVFRTNRNVKPRDRRLASTSFRMRRAGARERPVDRGCPTRRGGGWRLALGGVAGAVSCLASGCSVAPLVRDAGRLGPSALTDLPAARSIEAIASDGVVLRGVFVESPDSDRVILHLLPSGASVTTGVPAGIGRVALSPILEALRQRGWSSVVFDYRGLGGSEGRRSTDRLLDDGRLMWQEAVRLAGGREDHVLIRAQSLGTIVAAGLLDADSGAGGAILYAPVRSSTIVGHASGQRGPLQSFLARLFFRSPDAPDLLDVLPGCSTPLLVVLPEEDRYLPADEARRLRAAIASAGQVVADHPGDHATTVLRAWGFVLDADGFFGEQTSEPLAAELEFLGGLTGVAP